MAEQHLGNCPSCVQNFMRMFCAITCDPSNSAFMNVGELYSDNISITIVNVYFANYYANQFYNSCKDIKVQDSRECSKMVNSDLCGNYDHCSGQIWLKHLGTTQPTSPAPFMLNFTFTSDPSGHDLPTNMSARNGTLLKCSDPVDGVTCTCRNCPAVCPHTADKVSVNIPFLAVGIFVAMISFTIYNVVFIYILMVSSSPVTAKKYTNLSSNGMSQRSYCSPYDNQKVDSWISQLFSWWGNVTDYWYLVVPAVLIVVFVCSTGMTFCDIKTDTVETWSASGTGDRTQQEKKYFSQYFGSSYHASQIVITAPHSPGFTFSDPVYYQVYYNASGLFWQYVLNEVSVVLIPDITLKPFAPYNKNCVIYSVLNYFQNSYELLNGEVKTVFTVNNNSSYHL